MFNNYREIVTKTIVGKGKKTRSLPVLPIIKERIKKYINSCPYTIMPA